jgi:hypothetical protein
MTFPDPVLKSFNGDIMMFALYDKALSEAEVKSTYEAYLPANNVPVGPASSPAGTVFGREDEAAEVISGATDYIYDFDVNGLGKGSKGNVQTLTKFVSVFTTLNDKTGSLLADNKALSKFGPVDSNYTALLFKSTSKDKYGLSFATIEVKARDSEGGESEVPASLQVNVAPTNDAPAGGLGASFLINQRVVKALDLAVSDVDCSSKEDAEPSTSSSCTSFGPKEVGIKLSRPQAQQFGKIYVRLNATAACVAGGAGATQVTEKETLVPLDRITSAGSAPRFVVPLCIEGCAPGACPDSINSISPVADG